MTFFVRVAFIAYLLPGSQSFGAETDGLISHTIQPETGPIIRNRLGAISLKHVPFGRGQGIRDGSSLGEMSVEALHQVQGRGVVDAPKRRNYILRTGQHESEREICDAFLALQTTDRRITGR